MSFDNQTGKSSGGFFNAIQNASLGQILIWILLIVAIVWGFVATTAMVIGMLIALAICAMCVAILGLVIKSIMPNRDE